MRRTMAAGAMLLLLGAACAQGSGGGGGGAPRRAVGGLEAGAVPEGAEPGAAELPRLGPSVIKTADLSLQVPTGDVDEAVDRATGTAARYGGFVVTTEMGGEDARGTVVLRVPSDRFEEALSDLKDLGTVDRERVEGEDVSEEFVDLEARLRNFEVQEAVLLRLMEDAATVTDTIRVQHELSGVQLQIEEIRGRLRFLHDRTAFATITVQVAELGAAAESGVFGRAWQRALRGFLEVVSSLIVALGYLVPLAALGGIAVLGYRRLRPRLGARPGATAA